MALLLLAAGAMWGWAPLARSLVQDAVVAVRALGPLLFFAAMAVLPTLGFPLLPFAVAAGPAFSPQLGVVGVVACAVAAVAGNVALSYVCAARWFRPLALRVLAWLGWTLPVGADELSWRWICIVRLAPGLPFFVQSYALGVMRARFWPYLVVSTLVPSGYIAGTVVLGESLWNADARSAYFATGLLVFVALILHWLKQRQPTG